jgi:putative membrane protein
MITWLLVAAIGALHVYILLLEMLWWETPRGMAAFGTTPEFASVTKAMAGNQGLYNGFLAAGLFWSLLLGLGGEGGKVAVFFMLCVFIAGVYGAVTVSWRIVVIQAVPAGLALVAMYLGW